MIESNFKFLLDLIRTIKYIILATLLTHGDRLGVRGGTGIVGMLGPIARGVQKVRSEYANLNKSIDYGYYGALPSVYFD